jgi:hypothetical protein
VVTGTAIVVVVVLLRAIAQGLRHLPQRARRVRRVAVKTRVVKSGNRRKHASRVNRVVDVKAASRVKHAKVANRVRLVKAVNPASSAKCASHGNRVNRARTVNARRNVPKLPIVVSVGSVGIAPNEANAASHSRKPPSKR